MDYDQLRNGIIAIAFIAFLGTALVLTLDSLRLSEISTVAASTATSERIVLANATPVALTNNWVIGLSSIVVNYSGTVVTLQTTEYVLASTNSDNYATIMLTNNSKNTNQSYINYTYRNELSKASVNQTGYGINGIVNSTSYFGTIGTLLGVAVIVMIVILAIGLYNR